MSTKCRLCQPGEHPVIDYSAEEKQARQAELEKMKKRREQWKARRDAGGRDTRKFTCPTCDAIVVGRARMTLHKSTHVSYKCKRCAADITGKTNYRNHIRGCRVVVRASLRDTRNAETTPLPLEGEPTPDRGEWRCGDCDDTFEDDAALARHMRQNAHRRPPRYRCAECDLPPVHTTDEIKEHCKTTRHTVRVPRDWICGECGSRFDTTEQRQSHGNTFHHDVTRERLRGDRDPELKMTCNCGADTFASVSLLKQHVKRGLRHNGRAGTGADFQMWAPGMQLHSDYVQKTRETLHCHRADTDENKPSAPLCRD